MTAAAITDFGQFAGLRARAEQNDPAVLREVAGQFEALFIQTMLENMRASELADPLFGSDQQKTYQSMLDQQLAVEMASGRGIGLADMLVRQLGGKPDASQPSTGEVPLADGQPPARELAWPVTPVAGDRSRGRWGSPDAFVRELWPYAERAAGRLNAAPEALLAQAALETGWGANVMQRSNGVSSYNLFGIKAGDGWSGGSVARPTIEYEDGIAIRRVASFRAYPGISEAFDDYVRLIGEHPRYSPVLAEGRDADGFAAALQRAGYATDPNYARKISRLVRGETMQTALAGLKNGSPMPISEERQPARVH
jgi:peptidoglycan hydrolase FlgJ